MSGFDPEEYKEIIESIKGLYDLTSRIDERQKYILQRFAVYDNKFKEISQNQTELEETLQNIEVHGTTAMGHELSRIEKWQDKTVQDIEDIQNKLIEFDEELQSYEDKSKPIEDEMIKHKKIRDLILDYIIKAVWTMVLGYILYKLNFQSPPSP